jgi:glycosyltransferase involved in cell wall biosynthesis
LNRSEVFILPSLYEGSPKALLEAMACGLPVIGTNVTGIKEVIADGENGLLCNTDSESIRDAIIRLLASGDMRRRLGSNARAQIESNYSMEKILEKEIAVHSTVL